MTFGRRLRELRLLSILSQAELAKILNVSKTTVCSWEHDSRSPSKSAIIEISKYFNVNTDYLLGISNEKGHFSFIPKNVTDNTHTVITDKTEAENVQLANFLINNLTKYENETGPLVNTEIVAIKHCILACLDVLKNTVKNKHKKGED